MLVIISKTSGIVVEATLNNWRSALNAIKSSDLDFNVDVKTKANEFINKVKEGYEDLYIKSYIKKGEC